MYKWVGAATIASLVLGCGHEDPEIECINNGICNRFHGGLCLEYEPTGHHWCSYPDLTCDSGRRWSDLDVGDELEGMCMEASPADAAVDGRVDAAIDAAVDAPWDAPDAGITTAWAPTLAAGNAVTCSRDGDDVRCWGDGANGALGRGNSDDIGDNEPASSAGVTEVGASVIGVSSFSRHVCVVVEGGGLRCWGQGLNGRLGYNGTSSVGDTETPASIGDVPVGFDTVEVSTGTAHTCALSTKGAVRCWGSNGNGRLGYGNTFTIGDDEEPATAGDVHLGGPARSVDAGGGHSCAIMETGQVKCGGFALDGQLGSGDAEDIGDHELPDSVGVVSLGGEALQIACGGAHTCALLVGGNVRCWGNASFGKLGYGDTEDIGDNELPSSVGPVDLGGPAIQIAAGQSHTCALMANGSVRCWGLATDGRLGNGNLEDIGDDADEVPSSIPPVDLGGIAEEIAAGSRHTCARMATGAIRCWGDNTDGTLGRGLSLAEDEDIGDKEAPSDLGDVPYL